MGSNSASNDSEMDTNSSFSDRTESMDSSQPSTFSERQYIRSSQEPADFSGFRIPKLTLVAREKPAEVQEESNEGFDEDSSSEPASADVSCHNSVPASPSESNSPSSSLPYHSVIKLSMAGDAPKVFKQ
jgi:hypothetical protein